MAHIGSVSNPKSQRSTNRTHTMSQSLPKTNPTWSPTLPRSISRNCKRNDPEQKVKDLSKGIQLFHALFPTQSRVDLRETTSRMSITAINLKDLEHIKDLGREPVTERSRIKLQPVQIKRIESEPEIAGVEQTLDNEIKRKRKVFPVRVVPKYSLTIATNLSKSSVASNPRYPVEPFSAPVQHVNLEDPKSSKPVKIAPTFCLNLPQLPFGLHQSYNHISDMRKMIMNPEEEDKPKLLNSEKTECRGEKVRAKGLEKEYLQKLNQMYQDYLIESDSAVAHGKRIRPRLGTVPAKMLAKYD